MTLYRLDEGIAVEDVTDLFESAKEAKSAYGANVVVLEAPPEVRVGWIWDGTQWNEPTRKDMAYDRQTDTFLPHDEYREILHQRTTNDTLEALRKIREGDTTIDWEAWLGELDAYNLAVERTKEQDTYPQKVTYPEYPVKPTEGGDRHGRWQVPPLQHAPGAFLVRGRVEAHPEVREEPEPPAVHGQPHRPSEAPPGHRAPPLNPFQHFG